MCKFITMKLLFHYRNLIYLLMYNIFSVCNKTFIQKQIIYVNTIFISGNFLRYHLAAATVVFIPAGSSHCAFGATLALDHRLAGARQ